MNPISTANNRVKSVDDLVHELRRLGEEFKNRLTLDNLRFGERYLKSEVEIIIHLLIGAEQCCAILKRDPILDISDSNGRKNTVAEGRDFQPGPLKPNGKQEAVFVNVVKLGDDTNRFIPTLVRLDSLYETYSLRADQLYSSFRFGFISGRLLRNGKKNILVPSRFLTIGFDQLPHQMVETASEMVYTFADDNKDNLRDWLNNPYLVNYVTNLRITLLHDRIRLGFDELVNSKVKIIDLVVGPFDFRPNVK